ncbi:PAS domain-containing protein [Polycladidibacter stylochi]|uniref:PAS domain-containing protein n=1 Tax=Polycladidibacter stylochi TaxID=1807766 RepID=UPI000829569C|nr:PAS domain-containing protein [Pseudovibrio stylochi]
MKHGATRLLYTYWDQVRADRQAPYRSDIHPSSIKPVLGDTFIIELKKNGDYLFRLAGTRICTLYARELKGFNFLNLWNQKDNATVKTVLNAITEETAAAVITFTGKTKYNDSIQIELLLLPLKVKGEGTTRILGSLVPMKRPYWFGCNQIIKQAINSMRIVWPDEIKASKSANLHREPSDLLSRLPQFDGNRAIPQPNKQTPRFSPAMIAGKQIKHLRVLDGGKLQ